jgi:hypothetical protein
MPHTPQGFGYAFAGLETRIVPMRQGCETLRLRSEYDDYQAWAGYGEMEDDRFVGVVVDYHTAAGYGRRVWLHYPWRRDGALAKPAHPERRCERRAPTWHMDLSRPSRVREANWEQLHTDLPLGTPVVAAGRQAGSADSPPQPAGLSRFAQTVGLDLRQWAPPDWDGRFWFGIGLQDAGSDRTFAAAILDRIADL